MHGELRSLMVKPPCQELRLAGPDPGAVEFRFQSAKQSGLMGERGGLTVAEVKINPGDFAHHPQVSPGYAFRVGHAIAPQPLAQILRLAHIDYFARRIAHEVNAGLRRDFSEEFPAQPLDERFGGSKQPLLTGGHAMMSTRSVSEGKSNFAQQRIRFLPGLSGPQHPQRESTTILKRFNRSEWWPACQREEFHRLTRDLVMRALL
jgi:hypothetical protein